MMGYLDRLKGMNSEKCLPYPLPKPPKAPYGSFASSQGGRFQKIAPDLERLIQRAATFYGYSHEDLAGVEDIARRDPEGLRLALETDVSFRGGANAPGGTP